MSLLKIPLRPMRNPMMLLALRSSSAMRPMEPPPIHKLAAPFESGFSQYTRNWSRDKKYDLKHAPQMGNTPLNFLTRRLNHAYELYPLIFLVGVWAGLFAFTVWYSFSKIEIYLDKTTGVEHPGSWARVRDKYYKMPTLLIDPYGLSHQRLEMMEVLEDEMLEAAKKRGTR